jgi:DNA-directed RNA polymerase specialized sigma24 family protein
VQRLDRRSDGTSSAQQVRSFFLEERSGDFTRSARATAARILDPGRVLRDGRFVSEEDLEDVVLDAWVDVDRAVRARRVEGPLEPFAKQVIRHKSLSLLRSRPVADERLDRPVLGRDGIAGCLGDTLPAHSGQPAGVSDSDWNRAASVVLAEAAEALRPAPKTLEAFAVYLACRLDAVWTYDLIVERDGCRRPTARQRLTEARNRLRAAGILRPELGLDQP